MRADVDPPKRDIFSSIKGRSSRRTLRQRCELFVVSGSDAGILTGDSYNLRMSVKSGRHVRLGLHRAITQTPYPSVSMLYQGIAVTQ